MGTYTLLTDGRAAMSEILRLCGAAKSRIEINMFIWRDDEAGSMLASALLAAADRGVNVSISKDRFGGVFELAEESGLSFWNDEADPVLNAVSAVLKTAMPPEKRRARAECKTNGLAVKLRAHPNVCLDVGRFKFDHTKFCIFDDETLLFGGINIEDKEITQDASGVEYHDFMIEAVSPEAVRLFRSRLSCPQYPERCREIDFIFNSFSSGRQISGMLPFYINFIAEAESSLDIIMPYIGDRRINTALAAAASRGVKVNIIMPAQANMQHDLNMLAAQRLFRHSGGGIRVWLSPRMCHAKLMISDGRTVTLGSANLNRDGTARGWQLNCVTEQPCIVEAVKLDFENELKNCMFCTDFRFSAIKAYIEDVLQG